MEELPHLTQDGEPPVSGTSPFPSFLHPSPAACEEARNALASLHGHAVTLRLGTSPKGDMLDSGSSRTVLDSLVRTILSQNTTDSTSLRAYLSLKEAFPTWTAVLASPNGPVEDAIRVGGLAEIKVQRIKIILQTLVDERGAPPSMEYVRSMSDEDAKREMLRFKGVGPKTVACVMMFCLDRDEFPVDTHVLHIGKRLGWLPQSAGREAAYEHLNAKVPAQLKYDLHVLLVEHGKRCTSCAKGGRLLKPEDGKCPLQHVHKQRYMQQESIEQVGQESSPFTPKDETPGGGDGDVGQPTELSKAGRGGKGARVKLEKQNVEEPAEGGMEGGKRKSVEGLGAGKKPKRDRKEELRSNLRTAAAGSVAGQKQPRTVKDDFREVKQEYKSTPSKVGADKSMKKTSSGGSPGKWVAKLQESASPRKRRAGT